MLRRRRHAPNPPHDAWRRAHFTARVISGISVCVIDAADDLARHEAEPDQWAPVNGSSAVEPAAATYPTRVPSLDGLPDPVIAIDDAGMLCYLNDMVTEVLGWTRDQLIGRPVLELLHPDDLNLVVSSMETVMSKKVGTLMTIRVLAADGSWTGLEIRGNIQHSDDKDLNVLVLRETSNRHHLDLDQGEVAVMRSVLANMRGMVALVDADGGVRSINGAVTRLLGHDPELVPGRQFIEFVHDDDREHVLGVVVPLGPFESAQLDARFLTTSGDAVTCEFTVNNLCDDPTVRGYIVSGQIAAGLADARNRVDFLAVHDSRTGLLNRDGFMKTANDLVRQGGGIGLLIIDVVRFRSINELYGESVGDAVLTAIAARIDEIRWPELVTARFGGDEFVLAVRSVSESVIELLRDRVIRALTPTMTVDDQYINVSVRTATAFDPNPVGLESVLASASNDLVRSKRNADPRSAEISIDSINERRQHLDQLRGALGSNEIQPYFQPIVAADGRVLSVEALVRWVHPVRGVLGVKEILPIAQMAGLAEAVDEQVLDLSLAFARRLTDLGFGHIEVHVNVDPKVISRAAFAPDFLERCALHGARPEQIVVELTETDLLAPGATSLDNMQELRRAGTHVSIDDFGTGYSSLSHLLELPVDGVKIDRRFVAGIDVDAAATNLTTAILGLSESLQLGCVAEGVEQPYQRDRLVALGCSAFQGWLYSPALPADELLAVLPSIDNESIALEG